MSDFRQNIKDISNKNKNMLRNITKDAFQIIPTLLIY